MHLKIYFDNLHATYRIEYWLFLFGVLINENNSFINSLKIIVNRFLTICLKCFYFLILDNHYKMLTF